MGLSIAKHAADVTGAEISMESEPGRGTTVMITFKRRDAAIGKIRRISAERALVRRIFCRFCGCGEVNAGRRLLLGRIFFAILRENEKRRSREMRKDWCWRAAV